jgi:glycosyltransferase involved in cell wall biosynthesis
MNMAGDRSSSSEAGSARESVPSRGQSPLGGVKVCYFGHYDLGYVRNRVLIKALRRSGADVIRVNDTRRFFSRAPRLAMGGLLQEFDVMIVGFPGYTDVPLAKLLGIVRRRPLILDAFVSMYETAVTDRRLTSRQSMLARRLFWEDKLACTLSDRVLLDTSAHISYFVDTFRLPASSFRRVWVGSDDEVMYPREERSEGDEFTVFFYGSFIPLHGIEHILGAAQELERRGEAIRFVIAGSGQTYPVIRRMATRLDISYVRFIGRVPYTALPSLLARSDLCLGIFGTSGKAHRVIPNKVFDALAMRRAVITGDTPAVRECLTHGGTAWLCPTGDPVALANAIVTLRDDPRLRDSIAHEGHELFRKSFSISAIAHQIAGVIQDVL